MRQRIARRLSAAWRTASIPVLSTALALVVAGVVVIASSAFTGNGFQPLLPVGAYLQLFVGAFGSTRLSGKPLAGSGDSA